MGDRLGTPGAVGFFSLITTMSSAATDVMLWCTCLQNYTHNTILDSRSRNTVTTESNRAESTWSRQLWIRPVQWAHSDPESGFTTTPESGSESPTRRADSLQPRRVDLGSRHIGNTGSCLITEVKQHWARLVLGWVTRPRSHMDPPESRFTLTRTRLFNFESVCDDTCLM